MSPGIIVIMAGMNLTGFHTFASISLPCQSSPTRGIQQRKAAL